MNNGQVKINAAFGIVLTWNNYYIQLLLSKKLRKQEVCLTTFRSANNSKSLKTWVLKRALDKFTNNTIRAYQSVSIALKKEIKNRSNHHHD